VRLGIDQRSCGSVAQQERVAVRIIGESNDGCPTCGEPNLAVATLSRLGAERQDFVRTLDTKVTDVHTNPRTRFTWL